ncbi:MAG: hypothetical protein IJ413_11885 [Bacteroides sp.]|nr:hypothetical protein [Bacteroides sp.]
MYDIIFSEKAINDILRLRKSEPAAYKKVGKLIEELKLHPTTGTGHPEQFMMTNNVTKPSEEVPTKIPKLP